MAADSQATTAASPKPRNLTWLWFTIGILTGGVVLIIATTIAFSLGMEAGRLREQIDREISEAAGEVSRQVNSKPPMPVTVTVRRAEFGPGLVLQLRNESDRYLTVALTQRNPTLKSEKRKAVSLPPRFLTELGWAEEFSWSSGDEVEIEHADYKAIQSRLP